MAIGSAQMQDLLVIETEEIRMWHVLARVLVTAMLATLPHSGASGATFRDDDAEREGTCARGITWKMSAKEDDGRIEIEAEFETNRANRRWTWVLKHNGSVSARGTSRTRGSSGSFEVERTAVDVTGSDTFRVRATREAAVCVARVTL